MNSNKKRAPHVLTETEYAEHQDTKTDIPPHHLCGLLRALRKAKGMSLSQFEERYNIPAVVVGAYERGDRIPPLHKLDIILGCFGYRLEAVPIDADAIRPTADMVSELRAIANQIETTMTGRAA